MVPSLVGEMRGCHFAARCPYVIDACRVAVPPLEPHVLGGHHVRCIRHAELASQRQALVPVA
jgi:ABC-type dipeptide/oligopeptide/nickel transport system ATPase component